MTRVELKVKEQRVEVWAGPAESARWLFTECAAKLALADQAEERACWHLDSCQFRSRPTCTPGRPGARSPGAAGAAAVGGAAGGVHDTLFERLAIDDPADGPRRLARAHMFHGVRYRSIRLSGGGRPRWRPGSRRQIRWDWLRASPATTVPAPQVPWR